MSRPTKLTPDVQETITKALGLGCTFEAAANAAGIAYETFNEWRKRGKAEAERRQSPRIQEGAKQWNDEQPYLQFSEAIKKALGDRQARWLSQIEKAANNGNWQAAAWKLERTEPDSFGRNRVDVNVQSIDLAGLTNEQLQRIAKGEHPTIVMADTGTG